MHTLLKASDFLEREWKNIPYDILRTDIRTMAFRYVVSEKFETDIYYRGEGNFDCYAKEMVNGQWAFVNFKRVLIDTQDLENFMTANALPFSQPKSVLEKPLEGWVSLKDTIMAELKAELSNYYESITRRVQVIEEKIWPYKIDLGNDINKDALLGGHGIPAEHFDKCIEPTLDSAPGAFKRTSYESDKVRQSVNGPLTPFGEGKRMLGLMKEGLEAIPGSRIGFHIMKDNEDVKVLHIENTDGTKPCFTIFEYARDTAVDMSITRGTYTLSTSYTPEPPPVPAEKETVVPMGDPVYDKEKHGPPYSHTGRDWGKSVTMEEENRSKKYPRVLVHKDGAVQNYPVGMEMNFDPEKHFLCINLEKLSPNMPNGFLGYTGTVPREPLYKVQDGTKIALEHIQGELRKFVEMIQDILKR